MTETIINTLTKIEGLRVAARTSTFLLRDKQLDIETIGAKLHVGAVLEGSVRREGQRLRVSAQLVNVSDGLNVWSETYNRSSEDVFTVQDEISWAIAEALENRFAPAPESRKVLAKAYTSNPEAYSLYLRGQYHLGGTTYAEIEKSIGYFAKAIEQDPNCALAYAGMAEAYDELGNMNLVPPRDVMPKARAAALKALAIDNSLSEAHAALGLVESTYDWNWRGAEREFKRAIELDPGYVSAYQWYGLTCLASTGRMVEALAAIRQARDLDPLSLYTSNNLGSILLRLGRYNEAIQIYRETLDLNPKFFWADRELGVALDQKQMFRDSVQTLEEARSISNGNPAVMAALGYSYAAAGETGKAQSILRELTEQTGKRYVPPYHVAAVYVGLGNRNQALEWLDRAYEDRSSWMNGIKVDPLFTPLHTDPHFIGILKKMGLEE
jgi:serine/threonine-protein kinase